jgi:nucleotidyltransferase substrate binding protein (TIGR01987 family)
LLSEALDDGVEALSQLEQEGVIQRFEYTFELAWLTLKDKLEYDGVVLATVTPRNVIREAFQAKLIEDGDTWIDMLTDRNLMSHTYDSTRFEVVIARISARYLCILAELRLQLEPELEEL